MGSLDNELCLKCKYFKAKETKVLAQAHCGSDAAIDMMFFTCECYEEHKADCLQFKGNNNEDTAKL